MIEETGSFRDPAGKIFYINGRIFRRLSKTGEKRFVFLHKEKIIDESIKKD